MPLQFRNTVLETIFHNKQIWFTSAELAKALQYSSSKSVSPKTDELYTNSTPFKHNLLIFIFSKSHRAWAQRKIGGGNILESNRDELRFFLLFDIF